MRSAALGLILLTSCASASKQNVKPLSGPIEVHGHRGARGLRPENTIPAFDFALLSGVEVLEMDLGVSKDGKLVIYHDQKINPAICSASSLPLQSLNFSELRKIDCGALRNPRFPDQVLVPGTHIPSLDEFFDWIKRSPNPLARTVRFNIEMKSEEDHPELAPSPERFARLLIQSLKKHGMLERSVIQSFDLRTLEAAKKIAPEATLSVLVEDRPKGSLLDEVKRLGAQISSPNHEWLTEADVSELHASGIRVIPWTANSERDWERLLSMGVDGIITDYPDRLIAYLKTLGLR